MLKYIANIITNIFLNPTVIEIITIIVIATLTIIALRRLFDAIERSKFSNNWIRTLIDSVRLPARGIITIYALFSIGEMLLRTNNTFHIRLLQARYVFVIASFTWLFFRWKTRVEKLLLKKFVRSSSRKSDTALFYALSKLTSIVIYTIIILILLDFFGVPLKAFLALGGVSSIAVGWAAKDVVANFFGGLMIFINRPFMIGDWIKSPNKNFEGTVEAIGWYMIQIRTFERRPMYIPNALITDAIIENPGRMYNRRIKEILGLRYDDISKVQPIIAGIETMLKEHPDIDQNQTVRVNFIHFGSSSLDLEVYTFTKTTSGSEYRVVQQDIFLRIATIIEQHGAQIAFPTQTVHIRQ